MEKEEKKSSKEIKSSKASSSDVSSTPKDVKQSKGYSNKAAIVVALRNKFFFIMYRYASLVFITSILSLAMSVWFLFFFANRPVPPQYIPINEDGTYIKLLPIDDCSSKTEAEIKRFTADGIKKLYKYDYINYSEQLQEAASYFTTKGWTDYLDSYTQSNTLLAVKENKWIVTIQAEGIPELVKTPFIEDGACTWELSAPVGISYIGNNSQTNKGDILLRVSRVSVLKSQEGLGIKRMIFRPKE